MPCAGRAPNSPGSCLIVPPPGSLVDGIAPKPRFVARLIAVRSGARQWTFPPADSLRLHALRAPPRSLPSAGCRPCVGWPRWWPSSTAWKRPRRMTSWKCLTGCCMSSSATPPKPTKVLAAACRTLLDPVFADSALRDTVFAHTPPHRLEQALACVDVLVRPPDDVYYRELDSHYRALRRFLPTLLKHIQFGASPAGEPVAAGFAWLRMHELRVKPEPPTPRDVISKSRRRYVLRSGCQPGHHAHLAGGGSSGATDPGIG